MIEIKNLKKSFGKHEILKGINLTIQDKEVVVIIGPSGSGKSTILRCINYLEEPTSGEIIVDGLTLDSTKKVNEVRMEVGMVFQRFNLFPHMTVLENIILAPVKTKRMTKEEATNVAIALLEKVGLSDKKDAYPGTLSGGQQQRVSIARVLTKKPKIIFADEPTGNLDKQTANEVMQVLFDYINENNAALVLVTHDNELAVKCDNSYKLENKELVQIS